MPVHLRGSSMFRHYFKYFLGAYQPVTDMRGMPFVLVSPPAVIGTRFGISTFPRSEFLCGCASGPYNVWCISPWKLDISHISHTRSLFRHSCYTSRLSLINSSIAYNST